jgi:hypothetical protein
MEATIITSIILPLQTFELGALTEGATMGTTRARIWLAVARIDRQEIERN